MFRKSKGVSQVVGATALLALAISATGVVAFTIDDTIVTLQNSVENRLEDERDASNAELSSFCDNGNIVLFNTGSSDINTDLVFGPDGDPIGQGELAPRDTLTTSYSSGSFEGEDVVTAENCD